MDLTGRLLRIAAARPHVLVVAVPGETEARLAAEAEIRRRGWPLAGSPAGADLLVVAGQPGPQLTTAVQTVWGQMPAPRARVTVTAPADVAAALDVATRELADAGTQQRDTNPGPAAPSVGEAHGDHGHGHGGGMEMPGGLPMADLGEDRDGLILDALHVPLGPLLPDWPAGLVLQLVLQGDVIREAEAEVLDPPDAAFCYWTEPARRAAAGEPVPGGDLARRAAAGHLDGLARFLGVAGWADPAARARSVRDALLAGAAADEIARDARALSRRVGRSRTLRWLIRGIPAGGGDVAGHLTARLAALDAALDDLENPRPADDADPAALHRLVLDRAATAPGELAAALVGGEFAAARLVVAALDPDPDSFTSAREVPHHGHD